MAQENLSFTNNTEYEGYNQSQQHGFKWEDEIRENVFDLPKESNNTDKYDIPKHKNNFDNTENISIKTTGSNTIYTSDILRFYNYDFNDKNTLIIIQYNQLEQYKSIKHIYEINYNRECHEKLFGNLPMEEVKEYVNNVKSIPKEIGGNEALQIFDYKEEKKKFEKYDNIIVINPKVDHSQSRVQCSIPNFEKNLKEFIINKSSSEYPNILRDKEIIRTIRSSKRERGGITVEYLRKLCKENNIKNRSKAKKKDDLIELLQNNNINF